MKRVKFGQPGRDEFVKAENRAYDKLLKAGYRPQGLDMMTDKMVVFKIENENTNKETRQIYYFDTWQDAVTELVKEI